MQIVIADCTQAPDSNTCTVQFPGEHQGSWRAWLSPAECRLWANSSCNVSGFCNNLLMRAVRFPEHHCSAWLINLYSMRLCRVSPLPKWSTVSSCWARVLFFNTESLVECECRSAGEGEGDGQSFSGVVREPGVSPPKTHDTALCTKPAPWRHGDTHRSSSDWSTGQHHLSSYTFPPTRFLLSPCCVNINL